MFFQLILNQSVQGDPFVYVSVFSAASANSAVTHALVENLLTAENAESAEENPNVRS